MLYGYPSIVKCPIPMYNIEKSKFADFVVTDWFCRDQSDYKFRSSDDLQSIDDASSICYYTYQFWNSPPNTAPLLRHKRKCVANQIKDMHTSGHRISFNNNDNHISVWIRTLIEHSCRLSATSQAHIAMRAMNDDYMLLWHIQSWVTSMERYIYAHMYTHVHHLLNLICKTIFSYTHLNTPFIMWIPILIE